MLRKAALLGLCAASVAHSTAQAQDDPRKDYLRLQATEFCAVVRRPPDRLANVLNQLVQTDPVAWGPVVAWWNAIAERYNALKCGEA